VLFSSSCASGFMLCYFLPAVQASMEVEWTALEKQLRKFVKKYVRGELTGDDEADEVARVQIGEDDTLDT